MTTKKALLVVGVLVVLIGLTFVVPARVVGIKSTREPLSLKTSRELSLLGGDLDGNGTPDWKDLVVKNTKTPTETPVVDESIQKRLNDPNNLTASFSKNLYIAAAYAKEKGGLTEAERSDLAKTVVEGEARKIVIKTYTVDDLRIAKTETPSTKKEYGNALGKLFKKAEGYKILSNDLVLVKTFNTSKDASILTPFTIKKNNITQTINDLLQLSVPYSAVPYHLLLINKLSIYKVTVESFSQIADDPVRATIALNSYQTTLESLASSMASIQTYFRLEGIVFTKNEDGYVLSSGSTK